MDPEIIKKMVVIWLSGQPLYWPHAIEFNLGQDVLASQVILDSGVPLVLVPCMSVASYLSVTGPELEYRIKNKSEVGTYLCETVTSQMSRRWSQNWLGSFPSGHIARVWMIMADEGDSENRFHAFTFQNYLGYFYSRICG